MFLNKFSPTGFYSSAVNNPFIQELRERSERQIAYSLEQVGAHTVPFQVGAVGKPVYLAAGDMARAQVWIDAGFTRAVRTPDSTLIFVTPEKAQQILADQIACMGCLSACGFSNWSQNEDGTTGRKPDPRSFCIQKTLQNISHDGDVENQLMFAGHNAYRFANDPYYANGFVPTVQAAGRTHSNRLLTSMLSAAFVKGLLLNLSTIVAIGPQNSLLLRQAVRREHAWLVALIMLSGDVWMITLGGFGIGHLLEGWPWIKLCLTVLGAGYIFRFGFNVFRQMLQAKILVAASGANRKNIIKAALAVTFLNPHALFEMVVLIGTMALQFQGGDKTYLHARRHDGFCPVVFWHSLDWPKAGAFLIAPQCVACDRWFYRGCDAGSVGNIGHRCMETGANPAGPA